MSGFRAAPRRFRSSRGTRFRFRISETADVTIRIKRVRRGRRARRAGRITRTDLAAGRRSIRLRRRALRPGRYRATIVATDGAANRSRPRRARFVVKAARRIR